MVVVERFHFPVNTSLQRGLLSPHHLHCERAQREKMCGGLVKLVWCLSLPNLLLMSVLKWDWTSQKQGDYRTTNGIDLTKTGDLSSWKSNQWICVLVTCQSPVDTIPCLICNHSIFGSCDPDFLLKHVTGFRRVMRSYSMEHSHAEQICFQRNIVGHLKPWFPVRFPI